MSKKKIETTTPAVQLGSAPPHQPLADECVHLFVDDQNLFWQIVNQDKGPNYRIDFGNLAMLAARDSQGRPRGIRSAYIAGVIPDDDTFWQVANNQGFTVRRGYLGASNRSKQDDAYLITDIVSTLFEAPGPATIVLIAGDADYVPPLKKSLAKGWRNEVAFVETGISGSLNQVVHEFRRITASAIEYRRGRP